MKLAGPSVNCRYFDHNATTPLSQEVLEVLLSAAAETFGNPSSIHQFGQAARRRLELARRQVASTLNCQDREVVFLSGGTEADNLAILGLVRAAAGPRRHVITSAIEHPTVLNACARLEREGVEVTYLPVGSDGLVDPAGVRKALRPHTVLITVMHANNELGAIQPIAEIARLGRQAGVAVHSDGVQAVGKIPVDLPQLGVDLYSLSGHKIYAPKGAGALFVREGLKLDPLLHGGPHERGLRPGTENLPGLAALGCAAAWVQANLASEAARLASLRDRLERGILARVPGASVNAARSPRLPNTSSIRFHGLTGDALLIALDLEGFAVSSGAACSSGAVEPSHVLKAIGLSNEQGRSTLRFSLGRANDAAQVDALVEALAAVAGRLRRVAPHA